MNPRDQQLLSLAKSLLQQTISSNIGWQRTDKVGRYLYVGDSLSVLIEGPTTVLSRALAATYSLTLVDSAGNTIDSVEARPNRNLTLSVAVSGDTSKSELVQEVEPILEHLFKAVEQYMSKPNPIIDDFIHEIDTK